MLRSIGNGSLKSARPHRLICLSRPAFAVSSDWVMGSLVELLDDGLRHNTQNGITGILAVEGNRFLQVLEGERVALERIFLRLSFDPRHYDFIRVREGPIIWRAFSDWTVTFAPPACQSGTRSQTIGFDNLSADELLKRAQKIRQTGMVCDVQIPVHKHG
jgi:hypothetical protein